MLEKRKLFLGAVLFRRLMLRDWLRRWLRVAAVAAIVALGTSVYIAIGLANRATISSFESFTEQISGRSDLVLTAATHSLSAADLAQARQILLDSEATLIPMLQASLALSPDSEPSQASTVGESFQAVGVDLLALGSFVARSREAGGNVGSFLEGLPDTNGFFSEAGTAREFAWNAEEPVVFFANDKQMTLRWLGAFPQVNEQPQASRILVFDIEDFSDLFHRQGEIDRVEILFPDTGPKQDWIADAIDRLRQANPGHWIVETQGQRQETGAAMTLALRMNLRALSILSLLVGVFLVFQALDSSVARRQKEVAILHSLGMPRPVTQLLWLSESALLGFLGSGLGLLLGTGLARASTVMVQETVNTLYYATGHTVSTLSLREALAAWLVTILAAVAAGWWPARQAAKLPIAQMLNRSGERATYSTRRHLLISLGLALVAVVALRIKPLTVASGHAIPVGGYAFAICQIGLAVVLGSLCLHRIGSLAKFSYRACVRVGLSQLRQPVARHRLALAGVILASGMTVAMIVLIASFESTVRSWIGQVLQADLFVSSKAADGLRSQARVPKSTYEAILANDEVVSGAIVQASRMRIDGRYTTLMGYDLDYSLNEDSFTWIKPPRSEKSPKQPGYAIVSESFAARFQKKVGDPVQLPYPTPPHNPNPSHASEVEVAGIFADYGDDQGSIGLDQRFYQELTGDLSARGIALHVGSPADQTTLAIRLRSQYPALQVVSNRWLREETLRIFNRVFAITHALQAIGMFIAVAGLGSMLFGLLLERRWEIGALRQLGMSRPQIALVCANEGTTLAALGTFFGVVLGFFLGLTLIFVVNKQSFGWTLSLTVPWLSVLMLFSTVVAVAATVSWLIGSRIAKLPMEREE